MSSSSTRADQGDDRGAGRPVDGRADGGTRGRVLDAAMDLFGRQGYRATTIAQIEQAAGLAPGAGGLYRHFPSKRALLEAGLRRQFDAGHELAELLDPAAVPTDAVGALVAVARAALRRLEQERDLNRVLVRDLADFPDLLAEVRDRELRRVHGALVAWLRVSGATEQSRAADADVEALAAVLMGAVSHFWIMRDVFGGAHPLGVDEERYVRALAALAARASH